MVATLAVWKTCELITFRMKLYTLKKLRRNYEKSEYKALKTEYKNRIKALKCELKGGVKHCTK